MDTYIRIRIDRIDKERFIQLAKDRGVSMSSLLRLWIDNENKTVEVEPEIQSPADLDTKAYVESQEYYV